jgi:DnaK suppressor protein
MDDHQARDLVAGERRRIEAALRELTGELEAEGVQERQQTGDSDAASELATEMVEGALVDDLRHELEAVQRAEERLAAGTYGRSVESGAAIPNDRLEAEPLAERTVEEQRRHHAGSS